MTIRRTPLMAYEWPEGFGDRVNPLRLRRSSIQRSNNLRPDFRPVPLLSFLQLRITGC